MSSSMHTRHLLASSSRCAALVVLLAAVGRSVPHFLHCTLVPKLRSLHEVQNQSPGLGGTVVGVLLLKGAGVAGGDDEGLDVPHLHLSLLANTRSPQ